MIDHVIVHETAVPATCTAPGTEHYHCENCDYGYDEEIPMVDHVIVHETAVPPTCTEAGTEHYHCENCDYGYDEEIQPLG
ncbi:MAG: hypothetical protein J6Z23_01570, partial [Lachnospiraceae bacterium]|nr:hypothetical protein [Lachnospiraceae bacterium]